MHALTPFIHPTTGQTRAWFVTAVETIAEPPNIMDPGTLDVPSCRGW